VEYPTVAAHAESPLEAAWRPRPGRLLGDVIVEMGLVNRAEVEGAVLAARESGQPMGQVLLDRAQLTSDQLARAVAERFGLEHFDISSFEVDIGVMALLEPDVARRLQAVPIGRREDGTLLVAMTEPSNVLAIDDIAMITGYGVQPVVAAPEDVQNLLGRISRLGEAVGDAIDESLDHGHESAPTDDDVLVGDAEDAPVVKLVRSVIAQAIEQGASDVHFDPGEEGMRVRFRIDGVLADGATIPRRLVNGVVSRIKILSDLDIAERRMPQDGRVGLLLDGRRVDLRVVILPLVAGESVVMRILDSGGAPLSLDSIGFEDADRAVLTAALRRPHGGVLVTGPTGSGKSTTLYGALGAILNGERTILTVEDPVEYRLAGIKQLQVNTRIGLTFAAGLKAMLRADPDVIMVGEIRDPDSARMAVQAAVTGHLVLSTLHTNDAPTAISRLVDMGVDAFLVASAINCVVAQRLARRLCEHCKRPATVPGSVVGVDGEDAVEIFEPEGCARCRSTGYRGRLGLFEVMPVTEEIRSLVVQSAPVDTIAAVAVAAGMRRLHEDGQAKVRAGLTSLAEIARVAV